MRKQFKFLVLLSFIAITFSSCSTAKLTTLTNGKQIDNRLVGVWKGSETGQQLADVNKEWEMERNSDGTFNLKFKTISEGITDEFEEAGNWWVKGSTFYEYHTDSDNTDTYKYTALKKEQVKFKMLSSEVNFEEGNYTFIDTKISKEIPKSSKKDGLSFETAIKVKDVKEEYIYVRNNCENCQMLGQSLLQHEGKAYDKLKLKKANGEEISFYFDISSFFGKF
ncbi:lipocalin-like domain-containing protein [Flavobacterium degerlachei]|jgi:hypothetical protein|uniref:Lipocalin-like domain-containing protein n=1 Tax=Flavobacterium degerlachei TaxID=229203 RepID=A0A1H2XDR0_9FLAO|nr:lipocalin family protein [Flavobacterium degerlachei]SDW90858.1 hypothetical protein SAMN05444338_105217 [Flavobacterium degerlachei]